MVSSHDIKQFYQLLPDCVVYKLVLNLCRTTNRVAVIELISRLWPTDNIEGVLMHSETRVIGKKANEFQGIESCLRKDHVVIDLVGCFNKMSPTG